MKGVKTSVTDDPELMRVKKNTTIASEVTSQGVRERQADQERMRSNVLQGEGRWVVGLLLVSLNFDSYGVII